MAATLVCAVPVGTDQFVTLLPNPQASQRYYKKEDALDLLFLKSL